MSNAQSRGVLVAKTMAVMVVVAVIATLAAHFIQRLVWGEVSRGVS